MDENFPHRVLFSSNPYLTFGNVYTSLSFSGVPFQDKSILISVEWFPGGLTLSEVGVLLYCFKITPSPKCVLSFPYQVRFQTEFSLLLCPFFFQALSFQFRVLLDLHIMFHITSLLLFLCILILLIDLCHLYICV